MYCYQGVWGGGTDYIGEKKTKQKRTKQKAKLNSKINYFLKKKRERKRRVGYESPRREEKTYLRKKDTTGKH